MECGSYLFALDISLTNVDLDWKHLYNEHSSHHEYHCTHRGI